jgi:8-oxo-dGTP diphosphatase
MKLVAAAVIISDGKVLIARRKKGETHEGLWEFPGGKVEPGETPQQCLERELIEELGLIVRAGKILADSIDRSDHGFFMIMAIEAEIQSGELKLTVHDKVEWIEPRDLTTFNLAPADRDLCMKICTSNQTHQNHDV